MAAFECIHEFHLECVISQLLDEDSHFAREPAQLIKVLHKGYRAQNPFCFRGHR